MSNTTISEAILAVIGGIAVTEEMDYQDEAAEYWAAIEAIKLLAADNRHEAAIVRLKFLAEEGDISRSDMDDVIAILTGDFVVDVSDYQEDG